MKIKFFLIMNILFFTTSCSINPYTNSKYGSLAIDAWFNDKTLGEKRKEIENINEIVNKECTYLEHKDNKYVFSCEITYKEKGETVIPLSKNSKMTVYAVFIKKENKEYDYKVYNSKYKDDVWKTDEYLNY